MSKISQNYSITIEGKMLVIDFDSSKYDKEYVPANSVVLKPHTNSLNYFSLNHIDLDWNRETSLSATSRSDLFAKIIDLISTNQSTATFFTEGANDAFGRLRSCEPNSIFDSQSQYDKTPLKWFEKTTGTASSTHNVTDCSVELTVGGTANDDIIRQSKRYFRYLPGNSQLIKSSFDMSQIGDGCTARIGYFDDDNGLFFAYDKTNDQLSFNVRKQGVDNTINQADWNVDVFDGSGPSTVSLDITKSQLLVIDMEWLGVGRVRFGFYKNGKPYYAHFFNHDDTGVYMSTANLPVRYQLTQDTTTGSQSSIKQICSSVFAEGGTNDSETGYPFAISNGITTRTTGTAGLPILSIRAKPQYKGQTNRSVIIPKNVNIYTADDVFCEIIYNGTLSGANFTDVHSDSAVQYDISATDVSGGIVIDDFYTTSGFKSNSTQLSGISSTLNSTLALVTNISASDSINLTLRAHAFSGTTGVSAAFGWREFR